MLSPFSFPDAEQDLVQRSYSSAQVILEYGSGSSTMLAKSLTGKYVLSVESDKTWAASLQMEIDGSSSNSRVIIWYVDIGPTGRWGRPLSDEGWQRYHQYPLSVWAQPFFRHPDVVLIDGRFRTACFLATALRITRPITVLFDDYFNRPRYHLVEKLGEPSCRVGRMAEFRLKPRVAEPWIQDLLVEQCTQRTLAGDEVDYDFDLRSD